MPPSELTLGAYLAARLQALGIQHYFSVPGDYNLVLLDELLTNNNLQMIGCCNELNAGYAADGYARARGIAVVVVTFGVGSLSVLNAVAGAYAEDLPLIVISGGPNTNDQAEHHLIHHSLAEHNFQFSRDIFRHVTAHAVIIDNIIDAPALIEQALTIAQQRRKPVYIEVACNLVSAKIPASPKYSPLCFSPKSDPAALAEAVEVTAELLNAATKPVLVAGSRLRSWGGIEPFERLATACEYAVAVMPDAKSFFPETHPGYIGMYWGNVSTPGCAAIVESADAYLFAGPLFNDYTTVGYTALINPKKTVEVYPDHIRLPGYNACHVYMSDYLSALAGKLTKNAASRQAYERIKGPAPEPESGDMQRPLTTARLTTCVQAMLDGNSNLVAEVGDSWLNGLKMRLPEGARFEFQMQWGAIGWAVPAVLGYSIGLPPSRRVIALIGDGSFQVSAQEVSTMIRYNANPILFLINNGGYTIEAEIHDGPYNTIKNWDYAGLVDVFNDKEGKGWSARVDNELALKEAIVRALGHDGPSLIECIIARNDCSKQLLVWGSRVAEANARPPRV